MQLTLLFIILCGTFVHVHSWGAIGHNIIARLAQTQLTNTTTDWVRSLMPWNLNGNLTAKALWADDIIHFNTSTSSVNNWKWSAPLHFINIPDWSCNYQFERDCINGTCVDGAIRNYTKRLETIELDYIQHQEALYFLIHFVGDIHQPLHTSFENDYGGNDVRGRFLNISGRTNLHSLWDTGILRYRIEKDFNLDSNLYYNYIYDLMIHQLPLLTNNDNDIQQWINENLYFVCQKIYFDDNNNIMNSSMDFSLNENYYRRSYPIIEQRLIQGGRRLGALLNRLSQNPTTSIITTQTTQLNLTIYILIIVVVGVFIISIILGIIFFIRHKIKHTQ